MSFDFGKLLEIAGFASNAVPSVRTNKRRAAVVAHDGFTLADFYNAHRNAIAGASAGLSLACAVTGYVRRKHGAEAISLWFGLSALFACMAYLSMSVEETGTTGTDGGPVTSNNAKVPSMLKKAEDWLDRRASDLDKSEPGWDDSTIKRIAL